MASAARMAKHLVQTNQAVCLAQQSTQSKLDALLQTNPLYKLFDQDPTHPYYELAAAGQRMLSEYEHLVAGLLDWTLGTRTIGQELAMAKERQVASGQHADVGLDALLQVKPLVMTEVEIAHKLLALYRAATATLSRAEPSMINHALHLQHGRKNGHRHKESPELKITIECRAAARSVKSLSDDLLDCGQDQTTVRRELEKMQVMLAFASQPKDTVIDALLNG
jgi:hypothetical protein